MTEEINLRELGVQGYIFLRMKAEDNEFNSAVHDSFRALADRECKNDYTVALAKLLEHYHSDAKFMACMAALEQIDARLTQVEDLVSQGVDKEDNGDTF